MRADFKRVGKLVNESSRRPTLFSSSSHDHPADCSSAVRKLCRWRGAYRCAVAQHATGCFDYAGRRIFFCSRQPCGSLRQSVQYHLRNVILLRQRSGKIPRFSLKGVGYGRGKLSFPVKREFSPPHKANIQRIALLRAISNICNVHSTSASARCACMESSESNWNIARKLCSLYEGR